MGGEEPDKEKSHSMTDYARYVSDISFRFVQPEDVRCEDGRFSVSRGSGELVRLLELPSGPLDYYNTRLPSVGRPVARILRKLCAMPRMSNFAVAAVINEAVARMRAPDSYVNVGVWHGSTFFAGLEGNEDRVCIGIDNFSEFAGDEVRQSFMSRFESYASERHRFYDMDYLHYFEAIHSEPIGVYFYDGSHSYRSQLQGLQVAERFFSDSCVVIVDDNNWFAPHQAVRDFIGGSEREFEILLDTTTTDHAHPTFWNGLMVLQGTGRSRSSSAVAVPDPSRYDDISPRTRRDFPEGSPAGLPPAEDPWPVSEDGGKGIPLVSLVVHNDRGDGTRLRQVIEGCIGQDWPRVEVLVADDHPTAESAGAAAACGVESFAATSPDRSALEDAFAATSGECVGFLDLDTSLRVDAVRLALAYPHATGRGRDLPARRFEWMKKGLVAIEEIAGGVPEDETVLVVNEELWNVEGMLPRRGLPFPSKDGRLWGKPPPDDRMAIEELEEARRHGAGFIAFAWPAYWWLDHYKLFHEHLRSSYRSVCETERVTVFDLRR